MFVIAAIHCDLYMFLEGFFLCMLSIFLRRGGRSESSPITFSFMVQYELYHGVVECGLGTRTKRLLNDSV